MVTDLLRALVDPTRRAILRLLREGELTAGEIADRFPLAKSTLSGHFAVLKAAGLIEGERRGQSIVYKLRPAALDEAIDSVMTELRAA